MTAALGGEAASELGSVFVSVLPTLAGGVGAMAEGGAAAGDAFAGAFAVRFTESFKDLPKEASSAFRGVRS